MSALRQPDTDFLLDLAAAGDTGAVDRLLARHRRRLQRMVMARLDPRLARRIDPSDVVQETLATASQQLPAFLRDRPLPFYAWLRQIAWNRLIDLHRRHVATARRSVSRECELALPLSNDSVVELARRLAVVSDSPSTVAVRQELHRRVREALAELPEALREVVLLRHIEQLSVAEVAAVQGVAEGTVKSRHFRALAQLQQALSHD